MSFVDYLQKYPRWVMDAEERNEAIENIEKAVDIDGVIKI